jgi:DNA repair exonuclease SbcCD ATPase subunit
MKTIKSLFIATLTLLAIGACSNKEQDTNTEMQEMKENAEQAYASTKQEFVTKVNDQLADLEQQMGALESKIQEKSGEGSEMLKEQWSKLQEQKQALEEDLASLQDQGEQDWQQLREQIDSQWTSLEESFQELKQKVGDG